MKFWNTKRFIKFFLVTKWKKKKKKEKKEKKKKKNKPRMSQVGVFVLSPIQWLWWGQIWNCEGGQISKQNQNQNPKNRIQNTKPTVFWIGLIARCGWWQSDATPVKLIRRCITRFPNTKLLLSLFNLVN